MGFTISQKIFSERLRSGDSVEFGKEIGVAVDQCLTQDSTGTMAWLEFESLGIDAAKPDVVVSYVDHTNACFKGESSEDHLFLQTAASRFGAIFSKPGNGVCHQVHYERFGRPGALLLGSDSHTPTAGALGMLGIGVGGMDVAVALGGGLFYLKVPRVIRIDLSGKLPWGVGAKDVILEVLRILTVKGGVGRILEYGGDGAHSLDVPQRATITNMGAETGATTSVFPSDEITRGFFKSQKRENAWKEIKPDPDAEYERIIEIDLSSLKPLVAMPGSPDNVKSMEEARGTKINQVHIGSCTNGSWRDLYIASRIMEGKTVHAGCEVMVVPGSRQVLQMLIKDGSLERLVNAGCRIMEPGCGPCIGMGFVPGAGHLSLRSVNRNWYGRGGNKDCLIALSSVEVCAASALQGEIADPRELPVVVLPSPEFIIDDSMLLHPSGKETEIIRGKNIAPLKPQSPLPEKIKAEVLITLGDGISTDDILPAGPLTQHLRSNLPEIARFAFYYLDETFSQRAREAKCGAIAAGENYGQGSSREHAALAPRELGISCIFAKSFARIHRKNLINCGIAPLVCNTDSLHQGDELEIDFSGVSEGIVRMKNLTNKEDINAQINMTALEIDILRSGGALAHAKKPM
ncbi:aconitate hydratase [Candidatus Sumerlaeota bacterium]|nr:aconitate hydratase [Candidatus Sumerlaeota bacterium]